MGINPIGLTGIEFVEFASPEPEKLDALFKAFGFSKVKRHTHKKIDYYRQNDIHFLINQEPGSFAQSFYQAHGPSICSMGWRVMDPIKAREEAIKRGAKGSELSDFNDPSGKKIPAIYGIGDSLIYFIGPSRPIDETYTKLGFGPHPKPFIQPDMGFASIDHLTNNVPQGTMAQWADFYKSVFGFTEIRYFDIRGVQTGLTSYALRSPDGSFCIPINEGTEEKSQINEYLREYKGSGIQHLAFQTNDILKSLEKLKDSAIETLDIDDDYYASIYDRVPNVLENKSKIRKFNVLVDGDDKGYLLQIFTKNLIGPIFIEIIQRKNNHSFGEGNFGALFRSIERDQKRRGTI